MSYRRLLDRLFNDPKTGFVGEEKLFRRAKQHEPSIKRKHIQQYLKQNEVHQVFQKPKQTNRIPKIHGRIGHYQADLTFLTRYKKQNSNYHILLNVVNVNTKFAYVEALKNKRQGTILTALESIRQRALNEGRPLNSLQTDNGSEFTNNRVMNWIEEHGIISHYCEVDDKKCLGIAERFNRTIKLLIEKYLTSKNSNRWIDEIEDFVKNYNSSYHRGIKNIPERMEIFDEVELIRTSIKHNKHMSNLGIQRGDFVRLLNKRGTFEKEGQRFTCKVFLVEKVGLNSIRVHGKAKKFKPAEVLQVPPFSREINNALRERQLKMFKADKRMREREGISPDRSHRKRSRR